MTITEAAITLLHQGAGRKRIRHRRPEAERDHRTVEPAHVIRAPAVSIRIRHCGASAENALDEHHATIIGRLFLRGQANNTDPSGISGPQFAAAEDYRRCVFRYHRIMGIPSPHCRTSDLGVASAGLSCMPESDTAEANTIKGEFRNCRRVLLDAGNSIGQGSRINAIVYKVVIEDGACYDFGNLKVGLNALARYFK